jgi:hypothetical protein
VGRLRHVACHVGRRGAFLAFLAVLDVVIGYGLTQPLPLGLTPRVLYAPMMDIAPLAVWAAWWVATGLLCAVAAVVYRLRWPTFGAAALVKTAWASCYLTGWVEHLPLYARGYQTALIYGLFAAVVMLIAGWRENGT